MRLVSFWTYGVPDTAPPAPVERPTNVSSTMRRQEPRKGLGYRYNGFINIGVFLNALKKPRLSA